MGNKWYNIHKERRLSDRGNAYGQKWISNKAERYVNNVNFVFFQYKRRIQSKLPRCLFYKVHWLWSELPDGNSGNGQTLEGKTGVWTGALFAAAGTAEVADP